MTLFYFRPESSRLARQVSWAEQLDERSMTLAPADWTTARQMKSGAMSPVASLSNQCVQYAQYGWMSRAGPANVGTERGVPCATDT
jgi:hypothetical protein